jgi:hypothetical protein
MADFQSNITFGPSKVDQILATVERIWNLPPPEHCCECTASLCPEFRDPRICEPCDQWLHEQY